MKNNFALIAIICLLVTCKSPEKLLRQGDYDGVIDRSIKTILKGKAKNEDKVLLDKAYNLANQRDQERINFLIRENRPENWEEVFHRYSALEARQTKVQKVLPLTISGRQVNYPKVDYTAKIIDAKKNAARYFYNDGVSQMNLNTKEGFRQAYFDFQKVSNYRPSDYPDLDNLMNEARYLGISRVLIELENRVPAKLPPSFFNEVQSVNVADLNGPWVEYHLERLDRETTFDYLITIFIRQINVTPPAVETSEYVRRKRIQDGYDYALDSRGNVMKDSLGNDIKIPRYRDLVCTVIQTKQHKSATVTGEIEFVSTNPKRMLKKEPVAGTSIFDYVSGKAVGDRDALLPEDWKLIDKDEVPFPDDMMMIRDCIPILRQAVSDAIRNNRNLIY
jgi:hypothetical protein